MISRLKAMGIDPESIPETAWEPIEYAQDGSWRKDRAWLEKPHGKFPGMSVIRKVNLFESDLIDMNREEFNESQTRRFGDGRVVARVPLNVFYRDFSTRLKEGDKDFTKWWLNRDENRPYRNFRGKI